MIFLVIALLFCTQYLLPTESRRGTYSKIAQVPQLKEQLFMIKSNHFLTIRSYDRNKMRVDHENYYNNELSPLPQTFDVCETKNSDNLLIPLWQRVIDYAHNPKKGLSNPLDSYDDVYDNSENRTVSGLDTLLTIARQKMTSLSIDNKEGIEQIINHTKLFYASLYDKKDDVISVLTHYGISLDINQKSTVVNFLIDSDNMHYMHRLHDKNIHLEFKQKLNSFDTNLHPLNIFISSIGILKGYGEQIRYQKNLLNNNIPSTEERNLFDWIDETTPLIKNLKPGALEIIDYCASYLDDNNKKVEEYLKKQPITKSPSHLVKSHNMLVAQFKSALKSLSEVGLISHNHIEFANKDCKEISNDTIGNNSIKGTLITKKTENKKPTKKIRHDKK